MPKPSVEFTVDPDARLVRLVCVRDPTLEELGKTIAAIIADPEYRPEFSFLADCTAVANAPTKDYVQRLVAFMGLQGAAVKGIRWAQVVQAGGTFGMARMGGMLGAEDLVDYQVFTDVPAAERWLADRT
jgi:hypothetical protein